MDCLSLSSGHRDFFLVASLGRCKFRLSAHLVSYILQAVLGGFARDFRCSQLADRVFKFSVSSKIVDFISSTSDILNAETSRFSSTSGVVAALTGLENWQTMSTRKIALGQSFIVVGKIDLFCRSGYRWDAPLTSANLIPLKSSVFDRLVYPRASAFNRTR